jgi:predicted DNA-binding transcriptional regulator AlpA
MDDIEFWPLDTVITKVGLSRSEIYRRAKDGSFPASRAYKNSTRRFWLSSDVRAWQRSELAGVDADGLIG